MASLEKLKCNAPRSKLHVYLIIFVVTLQCHLVETQRSSPCHGRCLYVEAFQQANCEKRSLDYIPIECNAASYLSLRYNHITNIEPGLFRGFPFLKYLILSNNNISRISANTFIGAPQLKSIKLLYNNLQAFDRNALNGTENRLRNIYLSRNSLKVIENGTFQLVPKLEVIDLSWNHQSHLTSGVFNDLQNLERLFLGMNKLVDLPANIFKDLTSLVYLDLSNNSLSSLTIDLFVHMNYLKTIDLSGNNLVSIGDVLSLPNIRLDLRWNSLGQLGNVSLEILTNNVDILFLEGNPWNCNCGVEPLRQWYQQLSVSNEEKIKFDNPVCSSPREVVNLTINSLNDSLCVDMIVKNKDAFKNSALYNRNDNSPSENLLMYQNDTRGSEIYSKEDGQLKLIVVVVPTIVVIFVLLVSAVLLKKHYNCVQTVDKDCEKNITLKGSEPEADLISTVVSEKNETEASSSEEDEEKDEHTPLINKTGNLRSRRRTPGGTFITPESEIIKDEGDNRKEDSNRKLRKKLDFQKNDTEASSSNKQVAGECSASFLKNESDMTLREDISHITNFEKNESDC